MTTTTAPTAFPTERDRLRAIFLGRDLTGDIETDQHFHRLADDYVGLLMVGAEATGYSLAWVETADDLERAEHELQRQAIDLWEAVEAIASVIESD
ncbi:hypothetical protein [Botrimarina mediterranea]|uniref:hypothetical protein n=1 Tax=Botrimarina mediterranea TaxID=2528022 RepID=UPI0011897008|nr:hypothetical protein K2D_05960 [Planctomycetes bacterium K2D]